MDVIGANREQCIGFMEYRDAYVRQYASTEIGFRSEYQAWARDSVDYWRSGRFVTQVPN